MAGMTTGQPTQGAGSGRKVQPVDRGSLILLDEGAKRLESLFGWSWGAERRSSGLPSVRTRSSRPSIRRREQVPA